MKIAQIAPLMESVPPRLYDNVRDPIPYYMLMLDRVREYADEFDILHFHIDQFHFPLFRTIAHRTVTTLHGRHDRAIRIARALEIPLKIAAKVDKVDEVYFREKIVPLLNQPGVEFIGEIDERAKSDFLGNAQALLFPVDWPEPFGLSMIEAMACGTPVLAFRCGSVPEILDSGVTGLIVDTMDEAIRMLPQVLALDRRVVRQRFEQRFSVTRMAKDYVHVYRSLLKRASLPEREAAVTRLQPELEKGMN